MKTYLNVPFAHSRYVKELGARFDMGRKLWYVPDGLDLWLFQPWIDPRASKWMAENASKLDRKSRKGR